MRHEGTTAQHQLMRPGAAAPHGRPGLVAVIVRAALLLGWTVILLNGLTEARDASVDELREDLADGSVSAIWVQRPGPSDELQGSLSLRWDAGVFDSFTRYEYRSDTGVDEAAELLEQARANGVAVRVVPIGADAPEDVVTADGWLVTTLGAWVAGVAALVAVAGWILLITSPQPWLATKWGWFWLLWAIPPLWLIFLLVEPRTLRLSARLAVSGQVPQPLPGRDRRLSGGWALLIACISTALLANAGVPILSGWA